MFLCKQTEHAEHVIKNGFSSKYIAYELRLIALYYRDKGVLPKERKEKIYEICQKHIEGFNRVHYYKEINRVITYSSNKRNKLIDIDSVPITLAELDYIGNLDIDYLCRKILFGYIVQVKLNKAKWMIKKDEDPNNEYFLYDTLLGKLMGYLGIDRSEFRKYGYQKTTDVNYYLNDNGIIEDLIGKIKLLYMYDIPEDNSIAFEVKVFEAMGLYYDLYCGIKNVKECKECSVPIKVKSNRTKYCGECSKDVKNKQNKKYYHLGK